MHRKMLSLGKFLAATAAALTMIPMQASAENVIVWATENVTPIVFDPHKIGPQFWLTNLYPVYDTVLIEDPSTGKLLPGLATEWKQIDGDGWEFKLRQGVLFQDGTPFNAEAVKLNIERAQTLKEVLRKNTQMAAQAIGRIEVVDDHTIHLFRNPEASIVNWGLLETSLTQNLGMMISPAAFNNPDLDRKPVGTGPFMVTNFIGEIVTYEPFENYWDRASIKVDKIIINDEGDPEADYAGIASGQYNVVELTATQTDKAKQTSGIDLHEITSLDVAYYSFNEDLAPLDNVKVRQALQYALDRQGLVDAALGGRGVPTTQYFPSDFAGYDPNFGVDHYGYDPEKAAALLKEAGYPDGIDLVFQIDQSGDERIRVAEAIEQLLGSVGIRIKTHIRQPSEPNLFLTGKAHAVGGLASKLDALQHIAGFYAQDGFLNPSGLKDETTQSLLEKAASLPNGSDGRWEEIRKASGHGADQAFAMPLYAVKKTWATRCVEGFKPPLSGMNINLARLSVRPDCK